MPAMPSVAQPVQLECCFDVASREALATTVLSRPLHIIETQTLRVMGALHAPPCAQQPLAHGHPLMPLGATHTIHGRRAFIDFTQAITAPFCCLALQALQTILKTILDHFAQPGAGRAPCPPDHITADGLPDMPFSTAEGIGLIAPVIAVGQTNPAAGGRSLLQFVQTVFATYPLAVLSLLTGRATSTAQDM